MRAYFCLSIALLTSSLPCWAEVVIDDFATYQTLSVGGPPAGPLSGFVAQSTLESIGGERDVYLERTSANAGTVAMDVSGSVASQLSYASAPFTSGNLLLTYDGADASSALNPTGLGGVDLTQLGANTGVFLRATSDLGSIITFTIYTDATHFSTASILIGADPTFTFQDYFTPFASFVAGGVGGADFTSVGAISLLLNGATQGTDVSLETVVAAPTPVPEPTGPLLIAVAGLFYHLRSRRR